MLNLGLKQKGGTQNKQSGASVKSVTKGIENVTIDDSPKTKNKNLDVATEFQQSNAKNAVSFVVIGKPPSFQFHLFKESLLSTELTPLKATSTPVKAL